MGRGEHSRRWSGDRIAALDRAQCAALPRVDPRERCRRFQRLAWLAPRDGPHRAINDPAEYRRATERFEAELTPAVARTIMMPGRSPQERSHAWLAAGLANIRQDPAEAVAFAGRKAWRYWRPWLDPQEHGRITVAGSAGLNILLFTFGAIGLARHWKTDRFATGWVITYFLVIWLAHIPHQVVMRFRIPFDRPPTDRVRSKCGDPARPARERWPVICPEGRIEKCEPNEHHIRGQVDRLLRAVLPKCQGNGQHTTCEQESAVTNHARQERSGGPQERYPEVGILEPALAAGRRVRS